MSTTKRPVKYVETEKDVEQNCIEICLQIMSFIIFMLTFPLAVFVCLLIMPEYERAIIFRLGRLKQGGPRGPGLVFVLPCIDIWTRVDLRTISYDVPAQEILSKDSVTIHLDAVVYYRIVNPLTAVIRVQHVHDATKRLAQTTLRNVAGTKKITELLSQRDEISQGIALILDKGTKPWGVKVERVEIKDVRLPLLLQRAMAAEAEAGREAKAKVVAAEGELNASKALKEAADVMSENPIALQLRYLQTLTLISGDRNKNIIFPFPMNLIKSFINALKSGKNNSSSNDDNNNDPRGRSMSFKVQNEKRSSASTQVDFEPRVINCPCAMHDLERNNVSSTGSFYPARSTTSHRQECNISKTNTTKSDLQNVV